MKIMKIAFVFAGLLFFSFGCASTGTHKQTEPAKKVFIEQFANKTVQYDLHTKLKEGITDRLMKNRRVELVNQADAEYTVVGEIASYDLTPLSYTSSNQVENYELTIIANVKMLAADGTAVWEDEMLGNSIYLTVEGSAGSMMPTTKTNAELELEARDDSIESLARDIAKRVIKGK